MDAAHRLIGSVVAAVLTVSCASHVNLDALDVHGPQGRAEWVYYQGTACDFRAAQRICITGVDEGRERDVTATIADVVSRELPHVSSDCGGPGRRIRAEYIGDYSRCTHCGPPGLSTRFGTALVRVETDGHYEVDTVWHDTYGGTAEEVAFRFGQALAAVLREATGPACMP